jgi:hypothetical protein
LIQPPQRSVFFHSIANLVEPHDSARRAVQLDRDPGVTVSRTKHRPRQHHVGEPRIFLVPSFRPAEVAMASSKATRFEVADSISYTICSASGRERPQNLLRSGFSIELVTKGELANSGSK